MHVSTQTKLTAPIAIVTGIVCGYLAPAYWVSGFALGILFGKIQGNSAVDGVKNGKPCNSLGQMMAYNSNNENEYKENAVLRLCNRSLPGLVTTSLNALACYVVVSKVSLPIIFGMSTFPLLLGAGGLFLGYTLGTYFCLEQLNTQAKLLDDKKIVGWLEKVVL